MSTHTTTPAPQTIELIRRLLEAAHRPADHRTHPPPPGSSPPTRTGQRSDHLRDLRRTAHRHHVIHLPRLPRTRKGLVSMHTTTRADDHTGKEPR